MSREENLEWFNSVIEEEHGNALTEDQLVIESEIDSFGITMVFLMLDQKFGDKFNKEWLQNTVIEELTVKDVLDRME